MRHLVITLALILLSACASSPTAPPATSPTTSSKAPSATAAVAPAESGIPPGYKLVERDGVRLICTRRAESGSRLKRETCLTEAQYVDMQMRGENVWQDLDKSINMSCGNARGGSCGQ